jgi:hypothetical protein
MKNTCNLNRFGQQQKIFQTLSSHFTTDINNCLLHKHEHLYLYLALKREVVTECVYLYD